MSDELVRVRDLKKIFSVPAGELHAVDGVDFWQHDRHCR